MDQPLPHESVESRRIEPGAAKAAFAIALAVFVGATSIFSAVMAIGIAPLHMNPTGISGEPNVPDNTARWLTYALAAVILLNSFYAFRNGRKSIGAALTTTVIFLVANIALAILFVQTW